MGTENDTMLTVQVSRWSQVAASPMVPENPSWYSQ
jgi:hypothetical protein